MLMYKKRCGNKPTDFFFLWLSPFSSILTATTKIYLQTCREKKKKKRRPVLKFLYYEVTKFILWGMSLEREGCQDMKHLNLWKVVRRSPRIEESHLPQLIPQLGHQGSAKH